MQHTPKYKLNLIDPSDEFSADPLNANATALETQLLAREAAEAALGTRLDALAADVGVHGKNCRIATGSYTGTGRYGPGNPNSLSFDFCPVCVLIGGTANTTSDWPAALLRPCPVSSCTGDTMHVQWQDKSVSWYGTNYEDSQLNSGNVTFYYVAFGYDSEN